ncbi:MAG: hypothetical protein Q9187_005296 [Circinaria calcarea]
MAFWPFGRKKKNSTNSSLGNRSPDRFKGKAAEGARIDPNQAMAEINASGLERNLGSKGSKSGKRNSARKLSKARSRTRVLEKDSSVPAVPPLPQNVVGATNCEEFNEKTAVIPGMKPSIHDLNQTPSRGDIPSYYFQNPLSNSSLQPENFTSKFQAPTLHSNKSISDGSLLRRKSSKRKADDQAREQEIRAMSSAIPIPIPKRPMSHASGLLARESKRVPGGINRHRDRPISEISIPVPESMHSTVSSSAEGHNFMISAFDALSPRPTIRYSENPRYALHSDDLGTSRTSTRKEKHPPITEAPFNSKERINDLADDLDASTLRALMDRDERRREKKRKSEQEKSQRRLQRRSERQKREGKDSQQMPYEKETEVNGSGMGDASKPQQHEKDSPFTMANQNGAKSPDSPNSPHSWLRDASKENLPPEDPFNDPTAESRFEEATPLSEKDEPVLETAKAIRLSQGNMSPPTSPRRYPQGPSNLSMLSDSASRSTPDIPARRQPDTTLRESDTSGNIAGSWTSFFKRGGTRAKRWSADQGRASPSEFSNTSRESFARQQLPPSAYARNVRARSGTPVRTQSKFREDLPELPISPPISRVQSPELQRTPGTPVIDALTPSSTRPLSEIHPAFREEVALSRHQSVRERSPDGPSPAILSQSLASVDSEGSWLSGRPPKRSSQQANLLRESAGSLRQRLRELGNSEENLDNADDGYFTRLTPGTESGLSSRQPSYSKRKVNRVEDVDPNLVSRSSLAIHTEGATLHGDVARYPTIIRRSPRIKSREGLLDDFQAGEESPGSAYSGDSPTGDTLHDQGPESERSSVHEATSVDLASKGRVKRMSAGSAKLLDLPPRSSTELKRLSSNSAEKSPLGAHFPTEGSELP